MNINYVFDKANQNILFSIPQAWLEYDDPYWVPPSQWDNGIAGLLIDYNLFTNYSAPKIAMKPLAPVATERRG